MGGNASASQKWFVGIFHRPDHGTTDLPDQNPGLAAANPGSINNSPSLNNSFPSGLASITEIIMTVHTGGVEATHELAQGSSVWLRLGGFSDHLLADL